MLDSRPPSPILQPVPLVVWVLALPIMAIEIVLSLADNGIIGGPLAIGWRLAALENFGFWPEYLRYMIASRYYPIEGIGRLFTYPFINGGPMQSIFVLMLLLAFGKMVANALSSLAVLVLFFIPSILTALIYTALLSGVKDPLIGGFPATYGLIGGFTLLTWLRLRHEGQNGYRAFSLIGFLIAVQILFSVFSGPDLSWAADFCGFAIGFVLSAVMAQKYARL